MTAADARFMAEALALGRARLGRTGANPAVGALVVADGKVVGRGATEEGGRPHAEPLALAQAGPRSKGATLYVTLEPCAHHGRAGPCAEAIVAAGIARVVSAMEDPDPRMRGAGHALLRDAGVAVEIGAGAAEAAYDHRGHVSRVTEGRPLVTLKLARTADGFAAGPPGASRLKITGAEAEARGHGLRATHDAILVGGATALADDPLLTVRAPGLDARPLRVVLDARLALSPTARLATSARETPTLLLASASAEAGRARALEAAGVEILRVEEGADGRLDLAAALRTLATRGLTRIFCEGGPRLAAALLAADLVDDAILLTAPRSLGAAGLPALDAPGAAALADVRRFVPLGAESWGADRAEVFTRIGRCSPA